MIKTFTITTDDGTKIELTIGLNDGHVTGKVL